MLCQKPRRPKRASSGFRTLATILAALWLLLNGSAFATPIVEAPWRPLPGAYRTSLFLSNLTPTPWQAIAETWSPHGSNVGGAPLDQAREMAGQTAAAPVCPCMQLPTV